MTLGLTVDGNASAQSEQLKSSKILLNKSPRNPFYTVTRYGLLRYRNVHIKMR